MGDYDSTTDAQMQTSKLNSGWFINVRLHSLWQQTHRHALNGNYPSWNVTLDRLWSELAADLQGGEDVKQDIEKFEKLTQAVNDELTKVKLDVQGFEKFTKEERGKLYDLYQALMKKEIFLRKVQNKQGKGTAYLDGDDEMTE